MTHLLPHFSELLGLETLTTTHNSTQNLYTAFCVHALMCMCVCLCSCHWLLYRIYILMKRPLYGKQNNAPPKIPIS